MSKITSELFYVDYKEPLKEVKYGFGYYGTIATTEDKSKIQCHICGGLYQHLGSHLVTHNISGVEYKKRFGLSNTTALCAEGSRDKFIHNGLNSTKAHDGLVQYWKDVKAGKIKRTIAQEWSLERRNKAGNCPEQTIKKIKDLSDKLGRTPTIKEAEAEFKGIRKTAHTLFGSWADLIRIAGLTPRKHWKDKGSATSKEQLIAMMQNFYDIHGRMPYASDFRRELLPNLRVVKYYYPSLDHARNAIFTPQQINNEIRRNGYKPKVLEVV